MLGDSHTLPTRTARPINLYVDFKILVLLNSTTDFKMLACAFLILLFFSNSNLGVNFAFVSGQSEKELLLELRNNLTYDSSVSTKLVHWNESINFCRWAGVECDEKGRVSSLDLSEESIYDGINGADNSLFRLTNLQSLSLAQNSFESVEFPSGFGQLTGLRYLNLSGSGFSGEVPSDLSNLRRLVFLDLSSLASSLNLPDLRRLIHNLTSLREVYLDGVNISANGNEWGGAISSSLPSLRVLSMPNSYLTGPFHPSLLKLGSLSHIHLDNNNFSSPFPEFFTDFPNLKALTLSSCDLSGVVPAKLFQVKSLQRIILGGNHNLGGSFPEFPVDGSLQQLELGGPKLSGTLPESIGNLGMLSDLSVVDSNISGPIPSTIENLTRLVVLNLGRNHFSGSIPSFALLKNLTTIDLRENRLTGQIPDSLWKGLDNLVSVDLSENSLEGEIPASLFLLPALETLLLSNNKFSGMTEASMNGLSPIQTLDLSANKIQGSIPRMLFELQNVSTLNLSLNMFSGSLELTDFQKLTRLGSLDLSYNNLSAHVNEEEGSFSSLPPQLWILRLASCKLQKLPYLANHSLLAMLDLSDNELDGEIPSWMWEVGAGSLRVLNLSLNQFTHLQEPYNLRRLQYLNLHANKLGGQIPSPLSSAVIFDFSSNNFSSIPSDIGNSLGPAVMFFSAADNKISGTIPPSFCNASNLDVLDLSNNRFHGEIPSCLLNNTLRVLNLRRNNIVGGIPDTFPVGCSLATLDLSGNVIRGKVPESLTRCSELEFLDLTNNMFDDSFPCWLNTLSKLRVLVLRSNMFHGNISCLGDANLWRDLQIIDFASNNISGLVPAKMFRNLNAFMIDGTQQFDHLHFGMQTVLGLYYQDSVTVTMKGQRRELGKIHTIFTSIDFSDNHLQGVIPETIGELKSLYLLNFSRNALSGHIPSSIGHLKKLQSLDLSFNSLDGKIPSQLADLTFLGVLNLSYNHLVGMIPRGTQLDGFTETSFIRNDELCGLPVNKTCIDDGAPPAFLQGEVEREQDYSLREIIVSAALGFVVGLGFIVVPLVFCKRWRSLSNKHLTRIILLVLRRQNHRPLKNEDW